MAAGGGANTFGLRVATRGDRATVAIVGELDLSTGPVLRGCLRELIAEGADQLALDLTGLEFVDPAGLKVVVAAFHELRRRGGRATLTLRQPNSYVARVLAATGVDQVVPVTA